jgi:hypothetical protein
MQSDGYPPPIYKPSRDRKAKDGTTIRGLLQTGKQIVRLDGPDGNVPGDARVESAASDHGEIGCRAGGADSDPK